MNRLNPWAAGTALSLTLAIIYTICTAAFALWPEAALGFFNAWVHAVDLRVLQPAVKAFSPGVFFYGLGGIAVAGFAGGALHAAIYNLVGRCPCWK
ncbi:MAG: DUF5676 family membrane protein [Pseudomonadota bacterium]|jgi:hypothetical protein